ncbi:MAG: hypothetical protein IJO68_04280 [Clostridia bacterium]|nr:hypothetical protein [Clostridia bacterium]
MKKILSIVLSILMVVTMIPLAVMPAGAADVTNISAWNDVNNNALIDSGETTYRWLQNAFSDSGREYIRLCSDIYLSNQTSAYAYPNTDNDFTLDLNGYQVTSTHYMYLDSDVSMTVKDTSPLQTGSMTSTGAAIFFFYGTLTVQSGTFTSVGNIFDNKGTLIINGGVFSSTGNGANLIGQNGTLTINGGEFNSTGNSVIYVNSESESITINGGYFGKKGQKGHIWMFYTTPIDLSDHNDANGIVINNHTGDTVEISRITLPEGCFLVDPSLETATELANDTIYSVASDATPYTVTFDANGGSGEMENRISHGIFELPSNKFTVPSGKIFKCWQIGDAEYKTGDRVTVTEDVTVKAVWLTPTVYCYNGDELVETIEVSGDDYSFYLPAAPEKTDDDLFFAGWAIDSPDSEHVYSAGGLYENAYAARNYYAKWIKPQAIWGADNSSLTECGTLAEAIEAANADSSIRYISLCEDVADAEFTIDGADITIDLKGHNISGGDYSVVFSVSSGSLTVNNSRTTGGVISGDINIVDVSSGAELTVNGGTFMPLLNEYAIKNQGTLTITDGTFYAKPSRAAVHTTHQDASVTLSGGTFVQESGTKGCIWYIDGILDLSDHADPTGITIYRYVNWESGEFSVPADYQLYLLSSGKTAQYENETTLTICKASGHPGFDEADWTDNGDGTHGYICVCGAGVSASHSGGTATCSKQAVCDKCGEVYGEVDKINHDETVEYENGFCPECGAYEPAELEDGYYQIENGGNLFWYANYINTVDRTANAVLTANIDLENRPWTPIGSTGEDSHNFRGIFDGQNYTIKGLYVEGGRAGLGFFGEVRTGTVKSFTIFGEVVVNTEVDYVGGVIGSVCGVNGETDLERNGAIIQQINSYVDITVKAHGVGKIGGFVGYANHQSLIEQCAWYGTFDAGEYRVDNGAGGFIGRIQENSSEVTIRNCGAYGTIKTNYAGDYNDTATIYMGGFLSFSNTNAKTTIENCLFAGKFERGENLTDEAFLGAFGTLRSANAIKNCYYLGDDGLEAVHSDSPLNSESENVEIYKITAEDLRGGNIATQLGALWVQGDDYYPVLKELSPHRHSYTYTDNGDGTHNKVCPVCGDKVDNEAHTGGTATCANKAFCGFCGEGYGEADKTNHDEAVEYENGFCPNCNVYESANDSDSDGYYEIDNAGKLYWFAAQVIGGNTAINGVLTDNITVNENVLTADGALNGDGSDFRAWTPIANGKYNNNYTGTFDGKGFTVSGLYFNDSETNKVGLFGAVSGGTVRNVGVTDSYISGSSYVGGIAGYIMNSTVEGCYNTGTVIGSVDYVGGVVGFKMHGNVEGSYNAGTVTGSRYVSGVIGYNYGTATDCYNTGSVSGSGSYVGGVVACNYGPITDFYNTGNIVGTIRVGGLVGYNNNDGTVTNCYNTGSVSGNDDVGGVVGGNYGAVTNCYSIGSTNTPNTVGGVVGYNEGTVTNSYYDSTVCSVDAIDFDRGTSTNVLDKTTDQFKSGEVAYLLQGDQTEQVWGQVIGTDNYPVLGGESVYYGYNSCADDAVMIYTNDSAVFTEKPAHSTGSESDIEATCVSKAYCSVCESEYGEVDADNHDIVIEEAVAPDCANTGLTEGEYCTRCDYKVTQEVVPALNHKDTLVQVEAKAPTCTEIGWDAYEYCTACNYTTYAEKEALDHDIIIDEAVAPTCEETGLTAGQHCSRCDAMTIIQEVVPALNHKDTLVQVEAKAPTCTDIGWDAYEYCTACNYTTYAEKEALDHDIIIDEAVAPQCEETGLTAGQHCSRCDAMTIIQEVVPALNHKDDDGDYKCDNGCGYEYEKPAEPDTPDTPDEPDEPADENCDHLCHKDGILGFFWKIIRFFQKLFGIKQYCDCGVMHW